MPIKKRDVQTAIRLPGDLYEKLKESGPNVSAEIRRRVEASFEREQSSVAETLKLSESVEKFATLISLQTGHQWHEHPAANRLMRHMLTSRLARLRPPGDVEFRNEELPSARLVAPDSDDIETMAQALEAMEFHTPALTPERQQRLVEMRDQSERTIRATLAKSGDKL